MKILTASQMRQVDLETTSRCGIPSLILMENAGIGVVRQMEQHFGDLKAHPLAILCGKGNNGGDGFVIARQLVMRGITPKVFLFAAAGELRGDAQINFEILRRMEVPVKILVEGSAAAEKIEELFTSLQNHILVDALLGTGTRLPVSSFYALLILQLQRMPHVVAIDVPSGVECESLEFKPRQLLAPTAELTITFTAPKPAHIFSPGADFSKKWVVVPIGTPAALLNEPQHYLNYFTREEAAACVRKCQRAPASHKGSFGHVLAIGGSLGKTGAASMTAQSALLAGAGLVTLATAAPCLPIVASQTLEVMTEPLEPTDNGAISHRAFEYGRMDALLKNKDLIALGPGLGSHQETAQFVWRLLEATPLPLVIDADGLNALQGRLDKLSGRDRLLVLTPHPGEFARLVGSTNQAVLENRIALARGFAQEHRLHLVLKGHRTLYATPQGQVFVNSTGNPGMATGGSGDVLTGLLSGLLAQALLAHLPIEEAIALAVFLHGLAGDIAREAAGEQSLLASDIMSNLPAAFLQLHKL